MNSIEFPISYYPSLGFLLFIMICIFNLNCSIYYHKVVWYTSVLFYLTCDRIICPKETVDGVISWWKKNFINYGFFSSEMTKPPTGEMDKH